MDTPSSWLPIPLLPRRQRTPTIANFWIKKQSSRRVESDGSDPFMTFGFHERLSCSCKVIPELRRHAAERINSFLEEPER